MSNLSANIEEKTKEDISNVTDVENEENENISQNLSLVFEKSHKQIGMLTGEFWKCSILILYSRLYILYYCGNQTSQQNDNFQSVF